MVRFEFDPVPEEIPLPAAPLIRAIAQVRFTRVPELVNAKAEEALASALTRFPIRGQVEGLSWVPGGDAIRESLKTFEDLEDRWKVTIGPEFLALETTNYLSRADFIATMREVLEGLATVQTPPRVTRIGMRFIDRIENPTDLQRLLNPALLGWIPYTDEWTLSHQIHQVLLQHPDKTAQVQVKSLCLPPNVTVDPAINPVESRSWVLDIDAFTEQRHGFDVEAMSSTLLRLSEMAYSVFRWSTTNQFLVHFGGVVEGGSK
jgi:uncharacterized protein (TIGR04255 family)